MMLALNLSLPATLPQGSGGGGPSYTRTAFVSDTGNDGTAALNQPSLPFATPTAAINALTYSYPGQGITLALMTDIGGSPSNFTMPSITTPLVLLGHEGIWQFSGLIQAAGSAGANGASGFQGEAGSPGGDGVGLTLDSIILAETLNAGGGTGGVGGDSGLSSTGGNGANGGNAGNVIMRNGATATVNLTGGAGGNGGGGDLFGGDAGNGGNGGNVTVGSGCTLVSSNLLGGSHGIGGGGAAPGSDGTDGTDGSIL